MNNHIFTYGNAAGILASGTLLSKLDEATIHFTEEKKIHNKISNADIGEKGRIYIIGMKFNGNHHKLFAELKNRELFEKWYIGKDPLPQDAGINIVSSNEASSCEIAYDLVKSNLDVMIPAIASVISGFKETKKVKEAISSHGAERVYRNAEIIKIGVIANIRNYGFKKKLIDSIKDGELPENNYRLISSYEKGRNFFSRIKRRIEINRLNLENLAFYHSDENLFGFTSLAALYLAESSNKKAGVIASSSGKGYYIKIIAKVDLRGIFRELKHTPIGEYNGRRSNYFVRIPKKEASEFITSLDSKISTIL